MNTFIWKNTEEKNRYGKNVPGGIPREEFESLLTKYLPVTAEQLRKICFL